MKYIDIILNNGERENFIDNDESSIDKYTKDLSNMFTTSNVTIFSVKNNNMTSNVIIRPSEVSLIRINEVIEEVITD